MTTNNNLLIHALRLNALFSGVCALIMFAAGGWIAVQLGLDSVVPIYATAGCLVLFATQLANIVRTRVIRSWEIAGIIGGDIAWIVASIVLVAMYFDSLTTTGLILVDAVAAAVLFFAIQQFRGLRGISRVRL
ncbi:MAG: hypothetical protein ACR2QI_02535 [Woeseiaceae bacterium]